MRGHRAPAPGGFECYLLVPDWGADRHANYHSDTYGYSDGYPNTYGHCDSHANPNGHFDALMPVGATFGSLAGSGPAQAPAPASPPAGGNMSNDHKLEAAKTNPVQVARINEAEARERVKSLATQLAQAKHGIEHYS